jgi:hypothetical protein
MRQNRRNRGIQVTPCPEGRDCATRVNKNLIIKNQCVIIFLRAKGDYPKMPRSDPTAATIQGPYASMPNGDRTGTEAGKKRPDAANTVSNS